MAKIKTTVYGEFRGADFSTDPSLVEKKRSPLCTNIIADSGGMPEKRPGWRVLHTLQGEIFGLFSHGGKLLCHAGTNLYTFDETGSNPALLLTGLHEGKSRGVSMGGTLWIVTGGEYIRYNGTTAERVTDAYIPTTVITRMPTGGGETYEQVNLLTPRRKNAFQTDGTTSTFTLDGSIDAEGTVRAWVWGEETSAFTLNRESGTVTMTTAPAAPDAGNADGLVVEFPHTVSGNADMVNGCSIITTYGLGGDNRVVISGNEDYPNRDWISGFNDPTYFPDLGYAELGSEETAIMGYVRVGNYQAIVKSDDGKEPTIYLRSATLDSDGKAVFTTQTALSGVGAVARGSFASLLDDPLFLSGTGVFGISVSDMSGQRVSQNRSYFLNPKLVKESLQEAQGITWKGMYLLAFPNGHVYVLDGRQQKSYRSAALGDFVYEAYYWDNVPAKCWMTREGSRDEQLYFGTASGKVCKLNADLESVTRYSDDGEAISAVWATKYDDDGTPAYFKTMLKKGCCVTLKPFARSSGTVYFRTDKTNGTEQRVAHDTMDIFDWEDIDFERFTFNGDDGPQEIFFNSKVKNYKRLQIIVRNAVKDEGFGVYQITKNYVVGNFAKATSSNADGVESEQPEAVEQEVEELFEAIFGEGTWEDGNG